MSVISFTYKNLLASLLSDDKEKLSSLVKRNFLQEHEYNKIIQLALLKKELPVIEKLASIKVPPLLNDHVQDVFPFDETTIRMGLCSNDVDTVRWFLQKCNFRYLSPEEQEGFLFKDVNLPPPKHLDVLLEEVSIPPLNLLYILTNITTQNPLWSAQQPSMMSCFKKVFSSLPFLTDPRVVDKCLKAQHHWDSLLWEECVNQGKQEELLVLLFTKAQTVVSKKLSKPNQKLLSSFVSRHLESIKPFLTKDHVNKLLKWNEKGGEYFPLFLKLKIKEKIEDTHSLHTMPQKSKRM